MVYMIVKKGLFSDRIDTFKDEAELMREYYRLGCLDVLGVYVIDLKTGKEHAFWKLGTELEKRLRK